MDYETLKALNPHLPPEIGDVPVPEKPGEGWDWEYLSDQEKQKATNDYPDAVQRRAEYEQAVQARLRSLIFLAAPKRLAETIKDLESRGLLQYDRQAKHYDLHPVVRGVAAGGLAQTERETYGQRVVDYFSSQPHNPYEQAETLEDVRDALQVVRTLIQMGRFQEADNAYTNDIANTLSHNLEEYAVILALVRPFFAAGWGTLPTQVPKSSATFLATDAGNALAALGQRREALAAYTSSLVAHLESKNWRGIGICLVNLSGTFANQNRLAKEDRCLRLTHDAAILTNDKLRLFKAHLERFEQLARLGQWAEAEANWQTLDPMGRDWDRVAYRPGQAEFCYAKARFWEGNLREEHLAKAERLASDGHVRPLTRSLHRLRGNWRLMQGEWKLAAESLHEAVRMAREVGQTDATAETQLALAKFRLGQLADPQREAELLAGARWISSLTLAELWRAIGDLERAIEHALAAYRWAWADGEPFVHRYDLNKSRALLEQLGAEIPNLPPYDPTKDEKLPWEDAVVAAIEELRAEKAVEAAPKEAEGKEQNSTENA